jgi:uncharacterized protein (TIGR00730 family)
MTTTTTITTTATTFPNTIKRIAIYCGANVGTDPAFKMAAESLAQKLVREGIGIVYGGGSVGLMGAVADAALAAGGEVIGVIPEAIKVLELGHDNLTELHTVPDMHSRKAMMLALSDAVIALPGGFGTLDEVFEALTWSQLDYHRKLCGFLNVNGFYDPLFRWMEHAIAVGLIKPINLDLVVRTNDIDEMLRELRTRAFPLAQKWMGR